MIKAVSALSLAGAALAFSIAGAAAADLPVKAPYAAPAPAYDWSGWFAGAGIGGSWNDLGWVFTANGSTPNGNPVRSDQAIAAFHGGAQYQFNTFGFGGLVLGYEYSASLPLETNWGNSLCPNPAFACQARLQSLYTIGGKLGIAFNQFMLYGSGGWAGGNVQTNATSGALVDYTKQWHTGWYVGGGLDYAFFQTAGTDWILGVDYKHVELDTRFHQSFRLPGIDDRNITPTSDQLLARLTVKFKGPLWPFGGGPVAARY